MKKRNKSIRKISFITLFTLQGILLLILMNQFYQSPRPFVDHIKDPKQTQDETTDDDWYRYDILKKKGRSIEVAFDENQANAPVQDLYLETNYDNLIMDPFQEQLRDTYIYQLPKKNLNYINELMMRADLCDAKWSQEVVDFIDVLDKQNAYWLTHGDSQVTKLASIQNNVSSALKAMHEETDASTIDLVKRCYKDYESYYMDKFEWGDGI